MTRTSIHEPRSHHSERLRRTNRDFQVGVVSRTNFCIVRIEGNIDTRSVKCSYVFPYAKQLNERAVQMRKFGEAAVIAAQRLKSGKYSDPVDAWNSATKTVFPSSRSLQNKGCPRGAFLGLCNEGLIDGLSAGAYSRATKNGQYAVQAIEVLRANRFIASQPDLLWKKIAGSAKTQNNQMDVVVGLWEAKRISRAL